MRFNSGHIQKLFNKILVPVDFSPRSQAAITKAIELANEFDCSVTVLHVETMAPFASVAFAEGHVVVPYPLLNNSSELQYKLERIVDKAARGFNMLPVIKTVLLCGTWNDCIIAYINQHDTDLVLLGQRSRILKKRSMYINPDLIAFKTNIPVITVPTSRRLSKLLSVVIPVTDFVPFRKLMYGIYLASHNNATIRLLSVQSGNHNERYEHCLAKTLSLLRDTTGIPTETDVIVSSNVAEALHDYSRLWSSDLVIVNPGKQSRMPGFFSRITGNILQKYASTPVLTISPILIDN